MSSLRCRRALVAITALGVLSIEMVAASSRFATAAPAPWVAYVLTSGAGGGGSSFPVSTGTNIPGNPIASPSNTAPQGIAITPDGSTAYVTDHYEFEQAIRTADNAAVSINAGIAPSGVAVTPDGTTAWVADSYDSQLIPISTATNHGGAPIPVAGSPSRLAITPDGSTAYAVNGSDITPASLANGHVGATVPVFSAGSSPVGIVITPSGSHLYDASNVTPSSGFVAVIAPGATPAVTKSIGPFGALGGIAMSPDGQTLWVADQGSNRLVPIDTATNAPGQPIGLSTIPNAVAITPDGRTAYVSTDRCWVLVIDLTSGKQLQQVNRPGGAIGCTSGVAITPDQAPTAAFSITTQPAGAPTAFNGSASFSPYQSIVSYAWTFGDGATATTSGPTISHIYGVAGTYTATLTVTNSSGTSTTKVFTGQTMSRNGGPTATRSLSVAIIAPGQPASTGGTTPSGGTNPSGGTTPSGTTPSGGTATTGTRAVTPSGTAPTLTVSPGVGPSGEVVSVSGTNFPPNTVVVVQWSPGIGSVQIDTGPLGQFTTALEVLPHDQLGNRQAVAVGFPSAVAPMLVVPSPTEPGGANVAILYHN